MNKLRFLCRHILLVYLTGTLGACVGCYGQPSLPPEQVSPTPTRAFLSHGDHPPQGFGAYGYVIFTKRPSEETRSKYLAVCSSFIRNLEPVESYPNSDPSSLMPTYWLLGRNAKMVRLDSCEELIEAYDYAYAKTIATAIDKVNSQGPILVAWEAPYPEGVALGNRLLIDFSPFTEEDLDRAFGIWMGRIAKDPKMWKGGRFDVVLIREELRTFLKKYGDQIMQVVGWRSDST